MFIQTHQGQMMKPGKRIVLKGILVGDVDATVQVIRKDDYYADRYWVLPVSPTTGTLATAVGLAVLAGTGTISYTDNVSVPLQWQNRSVLTGVGTLFVTEVLDNTYIKAASATAWGQIKTIATDTTGNFLTFQPANFVAQAFVRSSFGIAEIKNQSRAYDFQNSPIKLDLRDNVIYGNQGAAGVTSPQGLLDLATCLDGIPRIIGNSTTPTVEIGYSRMRFAYTAPTTITDIKDGAEGVELLIYCDGNVTFGFASGGTKLKGNAGANKTPAAGAIAMCRYIQGFWLCNFVDV
jgi:hypothetical protein